MANLPAHFLSSCEQSQQDKTVCYQLGVRLADHEKIIEAATQHSGNIESICYFLERQPFNDLTPQGKYNYPTTDCNRDTIHAGCVDYLNKIVKQEK